MATVRAISQAAAYLAVSMTVLGCWGLVPAQNAYTIVNRTTACVGGGAWVVHAMAPATATAQRTAALRRRLLHMAG